MTWYKRSDSEYEAIGEQGTFSVWRKDGIWKARYWAHNKSCLTFLLPEKNSQEYAMKICENDKRWETEHSNNSNVYFRNPYKGAEVRI